MRYIIDAHKAEVTAIIARRDFNFKTIVYTASADGTAKAWRGLEHTLLQEYPRKDHYQAQFEGHTGRILAMVISRECGAGQGTCIIFTASADTTAKMWDSVSGGLMKTFGQKEISDPNGARLFWETVGVAFSKADEGKTVNIRYDDVVVDGIFRPVQVV